MLLPEVAFQVAAKFTSRKGLHDVMRLLLITISFILPLILTGCQSNRMSGEAVELTDALALPDTTLPIQSADVRIGPLDLIDISVFGASDLNGSYQVDFEGRLKLPLIGTLQGAGLTTSQLAVELEQRLNESFLQSADVTVRMKESRRRLMTIDGSVKSPGMYPVDGQLTLMQAIALAGGASDGADSRRVVVFRQIEGERHAAVFNLLDIRRGQAEDPLVYANDIVVMDGSEARRNYGEVLRSLPLLAFFMAF